MNERLSRPVRQKGNDIQRLRTVGLFLVACGVAGNTIIFNKLLNAPADTTSLEAALENNMGLGFAAIVAVLLKFCAVPIFSFLLVEGAKHTSCYWKYFLRVLGLAVVSEIPYDLAMSGKPFDWSAQNPVFGLVIGLVMIFFFQLYCAKYNKFYKRDNHIAMRIFVGVLVVLIAVFWRAMMRIEEEVALPTILIVAALWFTQSKRNIQVMAGCIVTCLCSVLSTNNIFYIGAPMVFLLIHFYNEEPGEGNKILNYAAYPAVLMAMWLIARFLI